MKYEILRDYPAERPEALWRDLLSRLEFPSHYDAPEYFMEPFWTGKQPFAILALEGDRGIGVLTGIHSGDEVICGVPSRPQIAIDPGVDSMSTVDTLLQGLFKESARQKLITVFSWPSLDVRPFSANGFRRRQLRGNVVLDLTKGADAVFQQFTKDRRRNIRYAEKNGISVRLATNRRDFRVAYDVYLGWRETERKHVLGERRTFEHFERSQVQSGNRRMFIAELDGKAIAINMFRFHPDGLFESAANCSLDKFLHLKPNDLLQWKGIEWACSSGLRRHSLGGSHPFLTRFGGTVVPVVRYRKDMTLLRRYDLREIAVDKVRKQFRAMPPQARDVIRRALGRTAN